MWIEPLDARRLFSAPAYTALDLRAAFPLGKSHPLEAVGLNSAGLVAVNDGRNGVAYVYSLHRHRFYAQPGVVGIDLNNASQLLDYSSAAYVLDGRRHPLNFSSGSGAGMTAEALNVRGDATGLLDTWRQTGPFEDGVMFQAAAYDSTTGQTTLLNVPTDAGDDYPQDSPPLLNENGVIAEYNFLYRSPTASPVQLPAGDRTITALSNHFAAGTAAGGFYLYDLQAGAQTIVPLPAGVLSFKPQAMSDDGSIVVGATTQFARVRHHTAQVGGLGLYEGGHFYDLNTLVSLPRGVRLAGAVAINRSGQILATDYELYPGEIVTGRQGEGGVFVLNPGSAGA